MMLTISGSDQRDGSPGGKEGDERENLDEPTAPVEGGKADSAQKDCQEGGQELWMARKARVGGEQGFGGGKVSVTGVKRDQGGEWKAIGDGYLVRGWC